MTGGDNSLQLRMAAREIFDEALQAVDAGGAVQRAIRLHGLSLKIGETDITLGPEQPVYAIAIGKAAPAMASGLIKALGERIKAAVIAGKPSGTSNLNLYSPWDVYAGGHPEPNEQSLAAAQACFKLLDRADRERALVIFLISGGGSSMLEWPSLDDIKLDDLRAANKALVSSGASIGEINAVRRAFSAVKGGRLAARAPHAEQLTLIVSDVPPGEERNVASGPTLAPPGSAPDAREVVTRYDLNSQLPETVLRSIGATSNVSNPIDDHSTSRRRHTVILHNGVALEAAAGAAQRRGLITEIASDISDQPIAAGCKQLLSRLDALREQSVPLGSAACLISGGEFACPVKGDGIGGRNLETALRLAIEYEGQNAASKATAARPFVALCAGTDGIDGNSPAAGAIVDQTTIARARAIGLDAEDFLKRSDAYSFFVALGDVVATGPTGTNVRDIRILFATA
jgi:glycerate 2-kinase